MNGSIFRGEIYFADLTPIIGSEQDGIRPVVIIQNDTGNKFSPTVIVAAITSKSNIKSRLPTHYLVENTLEQDKESMVLLEQIRTIDKKRLKGFVCKLESWQMDEINQHILISLGIEK